MAKEVSDLTLAVRYARLHNSASKRGLEMSLPFEELRMILGVEHCQMTGIKLEPYEDNLPNYDSATFERINPNLGYVSGNVMMVCQGYNSLKNQLFEQGSSHALSKAPVVDIQRILLALSKTNIIPREVSK